MWLRDVLDFLCHQKLRELSDFEWQQFLRLYVREDPGKIYIMIRDTLYELHILHCFTVSKRQTPTFHCLDVQLSYHCEFTGCQSLPPYSPRLGNCLIALTQVTTVYMTLYLELFIRVCKFVLYYIRMRLRYSSKVTLHSLDILECKSSTSRVRVE